MEVSTRISKVFGEKIMRGCPLQLNFRRLLETQSWEGLFFSSEAQTGVKVIFRKEMKAASSDAGGWGVCWGGAQRRRGARAGGGEDEKGQR